METTDFCSYELSKRLKDCGFNEPCDHYYNGHGNLNRYADALISECKKGGVNA